MSSRLVAPLSEFELTQIGDKIARRTREAIWFIRVPVSSGAGRIVTVHLAPQKQTSRIRRGHAYPILLHPYTYPIWTHQIGAWLSHPDEYFQVSRPDETFGQQLAIPAAGELPFFPPSIIDPNSEKASPMPEDEVIRVVDFIRRPSSYENSTTMALSDKLMMARKAQELPLLSISRHGGTIEVMWGYWFGPLAGYGRMAALECTPAGYRVATWGEWIS